MKPWSCPSFAKRDRNEEGPTDRLSDFSFHREEETGSRLAAFKLLLTWGSQQEICRGSWDLTPCRLGSCQALEG